MTLPTRPTSLADAPRTSLDIEVCILGGGVMGAATAWALTRRGVRVALVDALAPGHELGSSHGDGRIARYTYSESVYLEMARRSFQLWRELEATADVTLLETTGSWECGAADGESLAELVEALESHDIPHEVWDATESNRRFPHFNLPKTSRAVYQKDGAVVRAERSWRCLWHLATVAGARMLTGAPVHEVEATPGGVVLRGPKLEIRAERLVLTAGAWSASLLAQTGLDLPLEVTRETVAYFAPAPNAVTSMADHRVGAMPTLIDYHEDLPFFALPSLADPAGDEHGVKVGWHHGGRVIEPTRVPTRFGAGEPEARVVDRIVSYVGDRFPYLQMRPMRTLTCLYTNTPDYHFVLGRHPRLAQIVMGAGFSGHGFKFAPVVGEILADLATGTDPDLDLHAFRPERFAQGPTARRRIA